jgi:small subunit ribosomal protein S1
MSDTPETAADPILDRNASLADIGAVWATLASKPGTIETATVKAVDPGGVTVELAAGEATVPLGDLGGATPAVGETLRVFVEQVLSAGPVVSASKARALDLFDRLEAAADRDEVVEGRVLCRVKGGLSVDVGMKAFLPDRRSDAPIGDIARFWVRGWDDRKDLFVLAREPRGTRERPDRADRGEPRRGREAPAAIADGVEGVAVAAEAAAPKAPIELPEAGAVLTGRVVRLAEFGAFVDLPGGATGLLHVKDLSWGRVQHPGEVVKIGDEVEVKVLEVKRAEGEGGKGDRIVLSRRALVPHPWETAATRLAVGARVEGPVISLADYGAFIEVEPGVEGLAHISELRWGAAPKHPKEVLRVGQRVSAEVILLDTEKKHLKLSLRKLAPNPIEALRERFPPGTRVTGTVRNVAQFGVFVLLDPATGYEGLVPTADLSWTPIAKPAAAFTPGQTVEALVLGIDEERGRCTLGIKQLAPAPELPALDAFTVGATLEGTVVRVKDFGAFVALSPGIDGLLHAGEMGLAEGQRPKDRLKVGQRVSVTIASLDVEARRIGLRLAAPAESPAEPAPVVEPGPAVEPGPTE